MHLEEFLHRCPELAQFCTQNGWIDDATLEYEIKAQDADGLVVAVQFEEIVMEGAGCVATRVPCFGQLRIELRDGEIQSARCL